MSAYAERLEALAAVLPTAARPAASASKPARPRARSVSMPVPPRTASASF